MKLNYAELNQRLRFLRTEAKLTQKQVADYLRVEVSTYAHYEKGDRKPDAKKLAALAGLYKLNDEMLGAEYPTEAFIIYEESDLERLECALDGCVWRNGDLSHNREQYIMLKEAADPIFKTRDDAISAYIANFDGFSSVSDMLNVKIDWRGEALIERYLSEAKKFFDMI